MKKVLLLLLAVTLTASLSVAQTCVRDSNLLVTGKLLSPAAYSPDSPFYNLHLACIGEAYNQSVTINVPPTYSTGTITVPITNVSIPVTGGIGMYPAGMNYTCDPPNCTFGANTLGCILLHGTPAGSNPAPDTLDLSLSATVGTPFGPFPVAFPGDAAPGNHYYLILNPMGGCMSAAAEPGSPFSALSATPNPFSGQTRIDAHSTQNGRFQFEVFDLLGNRVHAESVQLFEGVNQFTFDGAQLPAGTYVYSLGNAGGKSVRKMVKM